MFSKTFRTGAVMLLSMGMALSAPLVAQAASTPISGTVNCSGTRAYYQTVRYMQQPSLTQAFLSKAAGGAHSGYQMRIGINVVANGAFHEASFQSANYWGTIQQNVGYVANTRFTMNAMMSLPSSGTCSNNWSATLYY